MKNAIAILGLLGALAFPIATRDVAGQVSPMGGGADKCTGKNCKVVSLTTTPITLGFGGLPTCTAGLRGQLKFVADAGYVQCNDGAWQLPGLGSGGYSVTAPIKLTGGTVIGCIMATGSVAGCVSAVAQTFAGVKTFNDAPDFQSGYTSRSIMYFEAGSATGVFVQHASDTGFYFGGNKSATDTGAEFIISTQTPRTAGNLIETHNDVYTPFATDFGGSIYTGCGPNPDGGFNYCGSFVDNSGVSGHISLTSRLGDFVVVAGQLPDNYYGHHGAVTIGNTGTKPQFLTEWISDNLGGATNFVLGVTDQGGISQSESGLSLAQFHPCGNFDLAPTDGGNQRTDAGYAFGSTLQYAHDLQKWYYCSVPGDVGAGTWLPVDTAGSGTVTAVTGTDPVVSSGGATPAISIAGSHVRANSTTAQSMSGSAATIVFENEVYDTLGEYDPSTGIFTAISAGYYQVSAHATLASTAMSVGWNFVLIAYLNGTLTAQGMQDTAGGSVTETFNSVVSTTFHLTAGQTILVKGQSNGATINTSTAAFANYITIDRLP